jgi:cytochrome b subunit of formate dehydrogenase
MIHLLKRIKSLKHIKYYLAFSLFSCFIGLAIYFLPVKLFGQDNDECLACHEDKELTMQKGKKKISLFVDKNKLKKSVHNGANCIQCHVGFDPVSIPHTESPVKVQCGGCHKSEQSLYNECLHGKASHKGDPLAPKCQTCHGSHEIVPNKDRQSPVYPLNVPGLCGRCHKEGSPVQLQRNIPQTHILENYSESIHGEGLIKKGLTVSATCASCHSPHRILPHTDPRSTINRNNIAATCTKCHAGIEFVHKKIIKGELWKKEAKVLPACVDCHQPHKIRKVFYEQNLSDESCRKCHENPKIGYSKTGKNMFVQHTDIINSVHTKIACTQCHTGVEPSHTRPCDNITHKVECASCHSAVGNDYKTSMHGRLFAIGDTVAPSCPDCHGTHKVLNKRDQNSPIFSLNIPTLCSKCHQEGQRAAIRYKGTEHQIINNYSESIHGKGLIKSGLTVTATCADCHTAHKGLPKHYPESSINPNNISTTCGRCHFGIQEHFDKSIHSPLVTKTNKQLPVCDDCHSAHTIKRTDQDNFRLEILNTCGKCHKAIAKTYFDTYHGKVSRLGSSKAAKCSDCHGSHDILSVFDPNSSLSRKNILTTCQKCHKNATKSFTRYLTHATHHDPAKYPFLFFTFWGMSLLLLGTFSISFLHTLLWLPRSIQMRKKIKALMKSEAETDTPQTRLFQRFTSLNRLLHFSLIISFITLAISGMILKFSYTPLSRLLSGLVGGVENAGTIHRLGATLLFTIFIIHIIDLLTKKKAELKSWKEFLFGPDSMVPNKKDLQDIVASFKWFIGLGKRPNYGRWTYWEKFDYFAVFWGIFVIGSTGLTLWFPEILSNLFPGWLINVATIVHSDEALLAAGFIFTVHFFNTHFRPEKFPMDTVIFSGQMSVGELEFDRPEEYEKLIESGELEKYLSPQFSPKILKLLKIFGWCALTLGLMIVIWIITAMIF